jgi:hypothetical protein
MARFLQQGGSVTVCNPARVRGFNAAQALRTIERNERDVAKLAKLNAKIAAIATKIAKRKR